MVEPHRGHTQRPRTQVGQINRKVSKRASEARTILRHGLGESTVRLFLRSGTMDREGTGAWAEGGIETLRQFTNSERSRACLRQTSPDLPHGSYWRSVLLSWPLFLCTSLTLILGW